MTKDIIPFSFDSSYAVHLQIGDYIDVWGERYELFESEEPTKENNSDYQYQMIFKAQYYHLADWKYRGYDSMNQLKMVEWDLMGTLEQFLDIAVANANRKDSGWTKGTFKPNTTPQFLSFNSENNILLTLDQLAKAFDTEWWVVNKTIHLIKRMEISGIVLEYGFEKGLDSGMRRTNLDTNSVFSQLYVEGSEQNLPKGYRNGQKRLQLPPEYEFLQGPKYGKTEIEHDILFDDIRPERIGMVTSVSDPFTFIDSGIDFNINSQIFVDQDGKQLISAKVSFLTGSLAGYNFDIPKGGYDHSTKTIRILKNELEKSFEMPSASLHPQVGDTYYVFDIQAPEAHLIAAQNRLLERGQEYLSKNGIPKFAYELPLDHFFFENNSTTLTLGNTVHVKELDLLLNKDIRIVGYVRDLHDEFKYLGMSLSDFVVGNPINRQYAAAEKTEKALVANKVYDIQRARNNWKTTSELSTMLDTIRAEMLLIMLEGGAYSTDIVSTLTLTDFSMTAGQIVHEQYVSPNNGIWDVSPYAASLPDPSTKYVYVRASRTINSASVVLSATKIAVESDPAFYYFPFGVISSVIDENRMFSSLRGYTKVTGGQIGTGIIVANNGGSWINLDAGTFNFENLLAKIAFTEDGVVLSGKIIATTAEFINLMVQNIETNATGKAVRITAENNNIQILNAFRQVLIEWDDDSAIEGTYGSSAPPVIDIDGKYPKNYLYSRNNPDGSFTYFYATLGPGGSVGISPTDANGYSTFGRKEIFTNGKIRVANASGTQESSVDKTGIATTGTLNVDGNSQLKGSLEVNGILKLWNPETSSWILGQNKRFAYSFGSDTYHFTTFNGMVYESGPGA
jgi:hypothetical protein